MYIVYDPEHVKKVLKKYLANLSDLLAVPDNMSAIGIRLYNEGLIPKETYENTITIATRQDVIKPIHYC